MSQLERLILETVAYYDAMDYPMTEFEIWKYLTNIQGEAGEEKYSLIDVIRTLRTSENLGRKIERRWGFWHLVGRSWLIEQRLERNKISDQKLKKIVKTVRRLRYVPFVRMVGVTGRVAMKNAEASSDLDVLIVLRHKRIFTGRLLVTGMVQLLGIRRQGNKIKDRICLNYFITDRSQEILTKDAFSASEYSFMLTLFGFEVYREFQKANHWIRRYKPNFFPDEIPPRKLVEDNWLSKLSRRIGESLPGQDWLEKKMKKWQVKKVYSNPKTRTPGGMIVADKDMLVFLPEPQGPKIYGMFRERMEKLDNWGIDENNNSTKI
jgi:hypothetical protein